MYSAGVDEGGVIGCINGSALIANCYALAKLTADAQRIRRGGIIGYAYDTVTCNGIWNSQSTGTTAGCGNSLTAPELFTGIGAPASLLKKPLLYSSLGWNFDSVWTMRSDSTCPGIRSVDNIPFAGNDTITTAAKIFSLGNLLANDFDIETKSTSLVLKVLSISAGATDSTGMLALFVPNGTVVTLTYRVGEKRAAVGDTLWGTTAAALVKLDTEFVSGAAPLHQPNASGFDLAYTNGRFLYSLPVPALVELELFNLNGQKVSQLMSKWREAGTHAYTLHAGQVAPGSYLAQLKAGTRRLQRMVTIAR
jgi:hypothetical protein